MARYVEKGHYILIIQAKGGLLARIGSLGEHRLEKGYYIYIGSAHGPGGLKARLRRHLCPTKKKLHWHIDYLIAAGAKPIAAIAAVSQRRMESIVAKECLKRCQVAIEKFGSSDTQDVTHLFKCGETLQQAVRTAMECLAITSGISTRQQSRQ